MSRPSIRLCSYNIRKALGTDRRRDPARILSVIASIAPDIAVLQEADLRLGRRPAALSRQAVKAAGYEVLPFDRSGVSLGWHGNAILLSNRLSATRCAHIELPGLEPRGAIAAEIATPDGPLRVIGLHLGLLRRSRRQQQEAVLAWLDAQPEMATVLAGDFNEWSATQGLEPLARRFDLHRPGLSFHARAPVAALDRIGTCGVLASGLKVRNDPLARRASDHLPVMADLRFPKAARTVD